MWRRYLLIAAILLILGFLGIAELWPFAVEGNPQRPPNPHNQYQPVYASLVQLLLGGWNWLRDWLDHDTITTIAIIATAIFTGTLWRATRQLQQTSETHAGHLEGSVIAAQAAAEAGLRAKGIVQSVNG